MTPNEDLQAAIAACRKASQPRSDPEWTVLATLEASSDANNAWKRLAFRPSPEKPIVHRKVVELIIYSYTLAANPSAFNTLVERKEKQFARHKSSVDDLIKYFSGSLSDPLVPSVTAGSSDYWRLVSILEDMRATLFLYRDFEVQDALTFPERSGARGKDAKARTFEHLLTT